jgi:hypothetical protein
LYIWKRLPQLILFEPILEDENTPNNLKIILNLLSTFVTVCKNIKTVKINYRFKALKIYFDFNYLVKNNLIDIDDDLLKEYDSI